MILNIKISNFRSIKDEIELGLEPVKLAEHQGNIIELSETRKILKSAVIYGPNASGKTNILRALRALQYLIIGSGDFKPGHSIPFYEPFKLDRKNINKPCSFDFEFIAKDGIRYLFILSILEKEVVKEELFFYPKSQKALIYSRQGNKIEYGDYYKGERKSIERRLLSNQLFISKAVSENVEVLNPVFAYFNEGLIIYNEQKNLFRLEQRYAKRLSDPEDQLFIKKFNSLICALDTGIAKVQSEQIYRDQVNSHLPEQILDKVKRNHQYHIITSHKQYNEGKEDGFTHFDSSEESEGTLNLFTIGGLILDVLEAGSVLAIDEMEKNLHPHITKFLIRMFHNPYINKRNAQLILTTHDTSQLDNDLFRRDQIWFTEKDELGATSLFSLIDVKGVRNTVPYDKWYTSGKIGATPLINELELLFEDAQTTEAE